MTDYSAAPHAIFSRSQIASVGLIEAKAKSQHKILVGRASYIDIAGGEVIADTEGFAKVVVEKTSGRIWDFILSSRKQPS